jgi:hypothetical protein
MQFKINDRNIVLLFISKKGKNAILSIRDRVVVDSIFSFFQLISLHVWALYNRFITILKLISSDRPKQYDDIKSAEYQDER